MQSWICLSSWGRLSIKMISYQYGDLLNKIVGSHLYDGNLHTRKYCLYIKTWPWNPTTICLQKPAICCICICTRSNRYDTKYIERWKDSFFITTPNQTDVNKVIWLLPFTGMWYYRQSTFDTHNGFWFNCTFHQLIRLCQAAESVITRRIHDIKFRAGTSCQLSMDESKTDIHSRPPQGYLRTTPEVFHNDNLVFDINVSSIQDTALAYWLLGDLDEILEK